MAELLAANQITIAKVLDGEQGIPGEKGADGKSSYFHIKYSSVANPTSSSQMTETPSTYIGTYVDFTEADSTDPTKYTWSRFEGIQGEKGEQGIPGIGTDGKTSYLHIAYATSADGSEGFSISESANKTYIGQYTDFTEADSTDYTKYSWTKIKGEMSAEQIAQLNQASEDASTAKDSVDTLSDKTRSGYIETLSGTGIVQSNKTEDGGTSEVVVYGKSVQDGTPTPDAPIEIQSVRNPNVTACGKNLAENKRKETVTTSGVTYTYIGDGKYSLSGTATGTNVIFLNQTVAANPDTIFLMKKDKTYKISGCQVYLKKTTDGSTVTYNGMTTAKTITLSTDCILVGIRALIISGTTYDSSVVYEPIICETTEDIVYEPYKGNTATLSGIVLRSLSDGTKDRLFKDSDGLWKIERNCGEVTYNGTESSWGYESAKNNCYIKGDTNKRPGVSFCSHFRYGTGNAPRFTVGSYFNFYTAETTTLAEWKTWLASNPITVVYALATPTYETLPTSIQEELNALTTYNPITNVMVSDGVNPNFDVSFWTRDYYAKNAAENASKVATNFINYDSTNGLVLGNKESGSWVGYRTQIDNDSFNVLDENGNIIASYGSNEVELGKGNPNAIIKMCDGKAYVKNYIVGSQNTSVFCGQDVTVVGEWEGASEAYALFKQGFINIGQASSHIKFSNENGNMNQVEIQGQNITINGELAFGTEADAAAARANLGLSGAETKKLLWTNAQPTSNFAAQTVGPSQGVDFTGYNFAEVIYRISTSDTQQIIERCEIGSGIRAERFYNPTSTSATLTNLYRGGDGASTSGYAFGNAYKKVATSTSASTDNSYLIPYKIYGIKVV